MLQGTVLKSFYNGGYTYKIEWKATQSVVNNTSTINWIAYMVAKSGYGMQTSSREGTVTIDDKTTTFTTPLNFNGGTTTKLGEGSTVVNHGASGTKTINISATLRIDILGLGTQYISPVNYTLDAIPRASEITTFDDFSPNKDLLVIAPLKHSTFTNTFELKLGRTVLAKKEGMGSSVTFTVAELEGIYNYMYTTFSMPAVLTVTTYNSNKEKVGASSVIKTVTLPKEIATSTIGDCGVVDLNNADSFLQNYSNLKIFMDVNLGKGAKNYQSTLYIDDKLVSNTNIFTFIPELSKDYTYKIEFIDSRGTSLVEEGIFFVDKYLKPTINNFNSYRCNEDGTRSKHGEHYYLNFNFKCEKNYATIYVYNDEVLIYREETQVVEGNFEKVFSEFNNVQRLYNLKIEISDGLGKELINLEIPQADVDVFISHITGQVGIGKYPENGKLDVDGDIYSNNYKVLTTTDLTNHVYVVEKKEISNDEWYIIYSDGTAEYSCYTKKYINITSAYGNLYLGAVYLYFPIKFKNKPAVTITDATCGTGASWGVPIDTSTIRSYIRIFDFYSRANTTSTRIGIYVKGLVDLNDYKL